MLEVPFKKTEKISYGPHLKKYISQSYGEDPKNYDNDCNALDELRAKTVGSTDIETYSRYTSYSHSSY